MLMVCNCFHVCVLITAGTFTAEVTKVSNVVVSPFSLYGIFLRSPKFLSVRMFSAITYLTFR